MMTESLVKNIVDELIDQTDIFIVEIKVSSSGKIYVAVDRPSGMPIEECVRISRGIEARLDRDVEDFSLEVSSPGLTEPFKVPQQYLKNIGKEVEVVMATGDTYIGVLKEYFEDKLVVETKEKIKGTKTFEIRDFELQLNDIKITRIHLTF